mmetsp:Transcript_1566/g.3004  ORF Transcript_1566/g.3004 Transcript_1566/m.3004 type:complete len:432 (-) Transcript_1566:157-1452(-)
MNRHCITMISGTKTNSPDFLARPINMKRLFLIPCLLELVSFADGTALGDLSRPIYPIDPDKGCHPGLPLTATCPVKTECFVDPNFENGGRCDCNPLWYKVPGKIPFDDNEWDDGFTAEDCVDNKLVRFIVGGFFFVILILGLAFFYTSVVVIRELIRVRALKWNATATSLIVLTYASVGLIAVTMIYLINQWDGERSEFSYHWRKNIFSFATQPANVIIDYEIVATWIDLWERTNKMSKSSSRTMKFLRYFLRFVAFMMAFGFGLIISSSSMAVLLGLAMMPSISGIIVVSIGGHLITKTLCPDRNDVANPNWKVTEAIRRGVTMVCGSKVGELIGLLGMLVTRNHPQLGYSYGFFNILFWFMYIFRMWGWLHYLIYGSRKHLKKYSTENASAYFGFSTIGLNKTLTTASSVVSTMSTRSSVAGASTVERD